MAKDSGYDAIFQDVKPLDIGGTDCYFQLRAVRPQSIVSLTTGFVYDDNHVIPKARAAGLRYVVFKPFRQDQVIKAVLGT